MIPIQSITKEIESALQTKNVRLPDISTSMAEQFRKDDLEKHTTPDDWEPRIDPRVRLQASEVRTAMEKIGSAPLTVSSGIADSILQSSQGTTPSTWSGTTTVSRIVELSQPGPSIGTRLANNTDTTLPDKVENSTGKLIDVDRQREGQPLHVSPGKKAIALHRSTFIHGIRKPLIVLLLFISSCIQELSFH